MMQVTIFYHIALFCVCCVFLETKRLNCIKLAEFGKLKMELFFFSLLAFLVGNWFVGSLVYQVLINLIF